MNSTMFVIEVEIMFEGISTIFQLRVLKWLSKNISTIMVSSTYHFAGF